VTAAAIQRELAGALAGLSRGDRDVLLLVAWADFSYGEVAAALGIPVGTVRSRLNRARRKVREALGGQDPTSSREELVVRRCLILWCLVWRVVVADFPSPLPVRTMDVVAEEAAGHVDRGRSW
jgi:DNA-binding CsgD family transcriptional regulator